MVYSAMVLKNSTRKTNGTYLELGLITSSLNRKQILLTIQDQVRKVALYKGAVRRQKGVAGFEKRAASS